MNAVYLQRSREVDAGEPSFLTAATPAPTGFYTLDLATWDIHCDEQTYAIHGVSFGEARLEAFVARVPPADLPDLLVAIGDLSRACGDYLIEYRIIQTDGSTRSMEARGRVLAGPDGSPLRMIGIVIDTSEHRAQRDAEHELATRLQHHLLPSVLADLPGIVTAARYLPATSGMLIGGDWYDAVPRPDGSLALVIGDVQGHSVEAACVMGQLRTALHAFLGEGHPVDRALAMTNRLLAADNRHVADGLFASCTIASITPDGLLQSCRAGHLPPLTVGLDGEARLLDLPDGLLLGIDPKAEYRAVEEPFVPMSTVFLCTDGLLETGCRDFDIGLRRVLPVLSVGRRADLEVLADDLLATAEPASARRDDIALLLARAL